MFGIISAIENNKAQNEAADRQYKYDKEVYKYQWNETQADYNWKLQDNQIQRQNIDNNLRYQEATAIREYQNQLAIRDFEYNNQVRQFNESERIYGLQLGFNNQAAQLAQENEARRYQEILTGMAFDQQDMLVKMLQEEGQLQAAGVSGRSATKALASAMASYGRNQAVMAESLVSATKESKVTRRQIGLEKYGADLAAQSRRMLPPLKAPPPWAPLSMSRPTILDPRQPVKPPKPIRGATASMFSSILGGLQQDANMALSIAALSDARLKENIVTVGQAPSGISIYEWNYKGSKQRFRGAVAQDVMNFSPNAVIKYKSGYLGVLYSLIDVSMTPIA